MTDTHFKDPPGTPPGGPPQGGPPGVPQGDPKGCPKGTLKEPRDNRTPQTSSSTDKTTWDLDHIFSETRVRKALEEFNPTTAAGPDGIRPIMLQKGWHQIKQIFTDICKASFRLGHTPACWRNSTGIFLPKPGKSDYYNPKSYRTITLAPVPLKWMERVILWHMEVDIDIYAKLSRKQYGFRKGCSTIAAVHKLVRKIENAILNQGMALGTFLDIEGAFDNVSFDAIEKALDAKCESTDVNRWIMSMIRYRKIEVGLHGAKRTVALRRGCPQGGILSPFLWNLVIDDLLTYCRDKIPCDSQGFADDMALLAIVLAPRLVGGKQGYDADTLREVTQKSLNTINEWCRSCGLKLSHLKTHAVLFTKRRNCTFSKPLMVDGTVIELKDSTKFLGIILDSKLSWNDHIDYVCKRSKGILMQCRMAVGPTWGFKPHTMRWIYNAIIRPAISYGATIWINGTKTKTNQTKLGRIQRLSNIMVTGALPSTPGTALDIITNTTPMELWLDEEAAKGALRLKSLGHWLTTPTSSKKPSKSFQSHISSMNDYLSDIPAAQEPQDNIIPILNIDQKFEVVIPSREDYPKLGDEAWSDISCFTDGSKMEESVGAAVVIYDAPDNVTHTKSFHLGASSTVFQAEVFAVGQAAITLVEMETIDKNVLINCDSQAAIRALTKTVIRSSAVHNANQALNKLAESNRVKLSWIPAHSGFAGNELADKYAKLGSMNTDAVNVKLPVPRCVCYAALRRKTYHRWTNYFGSNLPRHFGMLWRDKFKKELPRLDRRELRIATQILTGHSVLNYHLNKLVPNTDPTCPLCEANEETVSHFLGQCPLRWKERVEYFDEHYTTASDIVDRWSLRQIIRYVDRTGRLKDIVQTVSPP